VAADRREGGAANQHEWKCGEGNGTGGIISCLDRKAEPQHTGPDRLHPPLRQAAAAQARSQAEQVRIVGARLGQDLPQGGRLQSHIGINEEHPLTHHLLHGTAAGPVLAHPALTGLPGPGIKQREAGSNALDTKSFPSDYGSPGLHLCPPRNTCCAM
jgi:hypothetical protein